MNTFFMILKVLLLKEQTIVVAILTVRGPESTRSWTRDPDVLLVDTPLLFLNFIAIIVPVLFSLFTMIYPCIARIKFPAI